jgi:hypothetical protein
MLTVEERSKAVGILVDSEINYINNQGGTYSAKMRGIFLSGFKGYGAYSDDELLRCLNIKAKQGDYNAQNFLSSVTAERFLL